MATITFAAGLLADITLSPQLFLAKNILSVCSAPLEVLISVLYWGLRLVCYLSLCLKQQFLTVFRLIPAWFFRIGHIFLSMPVSTASVDLNNLADCNIDLSFHAVPSIMMLIDLLFLSPPWTITIFPALGLSGTIAFGYWFWIERCYMYNGWYERHCNGLSPHGKITCANMIRYPYPIFEQLETNGRIGLFALSAVVMALSTSTLKWLYGRVNGFGTSTPATSRPGAVKQNGVF